eukprot:TRINITY_DN34102_c0_g1_i1.p1 TRINITY_DN34102_c0_g1~~TRINITY_DN34102_c0_g1_i1.p1  ORF type:complete len:295 (-),score=68.63 TRINITY_DN34102_c0_g1_i1:149-955(-)
MAASLPRLSSIRRRASPKVGLLSCVAVSALCGFLGGALNFAAQGGAEVRQQRRPAHAAASALAVSTHSESATGRRSSVARQGQISVPGDVKRGVKMLVDGAPVEVMEFEIHKRGRGGSMVRMKLRNLISGASEQKNLGSGSKYEEIETMWKDATYSYHDDTTDEFVFLDSETFEEMRLGGKILGDFKDWIKDGQAVDMELYNDRVINFRNRADIIEEIIEVRQKTDSMQKAHVTCVLANGVARQGPYYLNVGDKVLIHPDTYEITKRV